MYREILFRGKDFILGEWKFGTLVVIDGMPHIIEDRDIKEERKYFWQFSDRPTWVRSGTIGQWSGLKDKDKKKIFEGDIVIRDGYPNRFICTWIEDFACFAFIEEIENGEPHYFQRIDENKLKIVDNN